jgi:PPP family 3-phenylpropionic acid transporter
MLPPGAPIAAFMAAIFMATGVSTAFLPLWLTEAGLSPRDIGEVLGLATFARLFAMPAWGWLADRTGRRRLVMAVSGVLATAASLAYLPAVGYVPLLLVALAHGATASALMPLADGLSIALMREGRLDYGRVRAVGSAAFMATTAVAGWLVAAFGARIVPIALALGFGAATALTAIMPEAAGIRGATRTDGGLRLLTHRPFLLIVAASALVQGSHAAIYGLGTLHWRAHGIGDGMIGLLWSEGVLAEVLLFVWGRRIGAALGPAWLIGLAGGAGLLRWTVTALTADLPALLLVQVLHAATYGMTHLASMLTLARVVPPERSGTAQALHATFGSAVPTGVMMWAAGWLYDGSGLVFLMMAAMAGAGMLLAPALARSLKTA